MVKIAIRSVVCHTVYMFRRAGIVECRFMKLLI